MFDMFCQQLALPQSLRSSVSTRTGRIVGRLNNDFRNLFSDTAHRFYAGSYGRRTAVVGLSDIDLICVLPYETYLQYNGYVGNKQSSLLQAVRSSLNKSYPNSAVVADGQIVKIEFTDGITYEIVPVFLNKDSSYTYPDSNDGGAWKSCKPKHEIDAFSVRDSECNGNLVSLGRMVRAWRDFHTVKMSGMLIDTITYQFMANWDFKDKSYLYFDYMTRDFFSYLGNIDRLQNYWLAPGSGSYVYRTGLFELKARQAATIAVNAIANLEATELWAAKQKFRQIYGSLFPS
jgi:Second Messenger Oligonucleotide or Dinucleotide Synthetase domain